ncbi:MAG: alpha/beta hydrolase, partial [Rubrivivax sp.]
ERPVVTVVAERDRIVPARFGMALHRSLIGPKHLLVILASDHNEWFGRVDAGWWRGVVETMLGKAE